MKFTHLDWFILFSKNIEFYINRETGKNLNNYKEGEVNLKKSFAFFIVSISLIIMIVPAVVIGQNNEELRVTGASTIQPIIEELSLLYKEIYGQEIYVESGGSGVGIDDALHERSDLGMVSRSLLEEEAKQLEQQLIGFDTIVFIVNESNPMTEITRDQIIDIFSKQSDTWSDFGWTDEPIVLISLEIGRSTLDLFEEYSGLKNHLRGEAGPVISEEAIQIGANIEAATLVGGIPNAIGYLSLGTALDLQQNGMPIKILQLDDVVATSENVVNGTYPILRELNVVYSEGKEARVSNLLQLLVSEQGQEIVEKHSFIPNN